LALKNNHTPKIIVPKLRKRKQIGATKSITPGNNDRNKPSNKLAQNTANMQATDANMQMNTMTCLNSTLPH
jgi:capsid protein